MQLPPDSMTLPWPPSVNNYWRRVGPRTMISHAGRLFREHVAYCVAMNRKPKLTGPLAVVMTAHPPDRRRRDLDNLLKALFDALEHAHVYQDDSQIAEIHIRRGQLAPGGRIVMAIYPVDKDYAQAIYSRCPWPKVRGDTEGHGPAC